MLTSQMIQGIWYGYINIFPPFSIIESLQFSRLYSKLLYTSNIKQPQALHVKYTFPFPYLAKRMLGTPTPLIWQVTSKCLPLYYLQKPICIRIFLGYLNSVARVLTKYCQLLKPNPYSQFSNSASKSSTDWWLENWLGLHKSQPCWDLWALVSLKSWVTSPVLEPLLGFQDCSKTVQLILKYSFI